MNADDSARPTRVRALAVSVGLSALFLIVYGACNWITAQRSDVGTLHFEWERHIPFVPLMIAPYMSIDLFFIAAPFLCRSDRELRTFALRIAAAIVIAGLCFLLFPFRFGFERPQAEGVLGAVFDWFRGMDLPYNLCPSLHITLGALLLPTYRRHTCGQLRLALTVWFALIAASAVLTHQHHVLDVVGGLVLAGYCFYFITDVPARSEVVPNRRIGSYYAAGAIVLALAVLMFRPWSIVLAWPALALAIAAAAYFAFGPAIFRKTDGRLPWSTNFALGPVLFGQYLSLLHYRRQCRAYDVVTPNVWIGRVLSEPDAAQVVAQGVTAVLDVTADFSAARAFRRVRYKNVQILDLTAPTAAQLQEMAAYIADAAERGIVYVHCKIGYSRSAAAVIAYLLHSGRAADFDEAAGIVRSVRPSVVIRPEIVDALRDFASRFSARVPTR